MANPATRIQVPLSYRIVASQLGVALVAGLGFLPLALQQAQAAWLAGVVTVLPGGYFAWRAHHERSPGRLLGQGVLKSLLTMVLMALVFATLKPPPLGFFVAFVLMLSMYVLVPLQSRDEAAVHRKTGRDG